MEVRNNVQSPSFGMALKAKSAKSYLQGVKKEFGTGSLAELSVLKSYLKNTKKYHLIIDSDGSRLIETPDGVNIIGESVSVMHKKGAKVINIYAKAKAKKSLDLRDYSKALLFQDAESAEAMCKLINEKPIGVFRDAYVTRMLDDYENYHEVIGKMSSDKTYADKLISELCGEGVLKRTFSAIKEFFKSIFTTNQK